MASSELRSIVRFRFRGDGDVEEFKRVSAQCMDIVRTQDTGNDGPVQLFTPWATM